MKNKIIALISLALVCVMLFASCAKPPYVSNFAGFTYIYEGEGAGGQFSVTINEDGTFSYFEGPESDYIGIGTWELDGARIKLSDRGDAGTVNYFTYERGFIIYSSRRSTGYKIVEVKNGERFRKVVPESTDPVIPE